MSEAGPGVVVLKLGGYPLHAGTIGIARSAGRMGLAVHVVGEPSSSPVARSRFVRETSTIPHGAAEFPERLARWLCDSAPPGRPLLVPVDDVGAAFLQRHGEMLTKAFRYQLIPPGLCEQLSGKASMAALARSAGVACPTHALPLTPTALEDFLADAPLPVVVKVNDPEIAKRNPGVPGVVIARSAAEVRDLWTRHLVDGVPNCILQDYIPGGADTVWMINGYVDSTSRLRFAATGRKLRQWRPYTGATSLGICERNDLVVELTERLVEHIGYRGILDIGWRFDARDGQYKLLDFNPRIGATFRLFAGDQDTDVLRALYADLVHGAVLDEEVRDGRTWVNDAYDWAASLRYINDRRLTLEGYRRSLRGVDESAWAAPDDPLPASAMRRVVAHSVVQGGFTAAAARLPLPTRPWRDVRWSRPLASVHRGSVSTTEDSS